MLKQMIPAVGHAAFPVVPAAGQMARMPVRLAAVLTAAHGKTPAASPVGGQAAVAVPVAAQVTMVSVSAEAVPMEAPVPVVRVDDP